MNTIVWRSLRVFCSAALAISLGKSGAAGATFASAHGALDPTFGVRGKIITNVPMGASDMVLDAARRFVIVGALTGIGGVPVQFGVARMFPGGAFDTRFGQDGVSAIAIGSRFSQASSVALQADGKIVVVGTSLTANFSVVGVARLNEDGSLDRSFGHGGQRVVVFLPGPANRAGPVLLQPDGKIVVGGSVGSLDAPSTALARLNPDGSLDRTFGHGGVDVLPLLGDINNLSLQSDGKILFSGAHPTATGVAVLRARVLRDGSIDSSSKPSTIIRTGDGGSMIFMPDSKLVYAATQVHQVNGLPDSDVQLLRFLTSGGPDPTFSSAPFDFGPELRTASVDQASAIQIDGLARFVVAGRADDSVGNSGFGLARLEANGSLDRQFGNGGRTRTTFLGTDTVKTIALQPDGKIVLAGLTSAGAHDVLCLARYMP